ncbi:MAG: hypothetical protein II934_06795, partial [Prevotella sp.]|nr:hypothetical protein [Prevotella sp.]
EIMRFFSGTNMLIIFPDQFGDAMNEMTFAQPQHTEELSYYDILRKWMIRLRNEGIAGVQKFRQYIKK